MIYGGGSVISNESGSNNEGEVKSSGGIGGSDWCSESMDSMLDLLPDSYSNSNIFLL